MPPQIQFGSIAPDDLVAVSGGARVTARSAGGPNDPTTMALTQITNSIKDLTSNKNQNDPTQLLLMMMLLGGGGLGGGGGGGFGGGPPMGGPPMPPPMQSAPAPIPTIRVTTRVAH